MIRIEVIKHQDCSDSCLTEISHFKNLNWKYPLESHLEWIRTNLKDDDHHILLYDDNVMVAYLNMVRVTVSDETNSWEAYGIGNVCVHPKAKGIGYGQLIMAAAKIYCKKNNTLGILFCQDKNIGFYTSCKWHLFVGKLKDRDQAECHINLFSTTNLDSEILSTNRDF